MKIKLFFSICLLQSFILVLYAQNEKNSLIILSNELIEVGVLPEVGGRIVLLKKPGYKNILKSDSLLWIDPEKTKPEISPFTEYFPYNGHITWVGPQSEWWIYQNLNKERKNFKADWPPDPYLTYGKYNIICKTDSSIKLEGPNSPITGVKFFKEVSINKKGIVTVSTTARNIRDSNVSWDLWMLTRLDGFANVYVPINQDGLLELRFQDTQSIQATPFEVIDGFFSFIPSLPESPAKDQIQEVHLSPSYGIIAGFSNNQMLLISFKKTDMKLIHPNHGLVELYSSVNEKGDDTLLELEVHGKYCELKPGEEMTLSENWLVFPYNGLNLKERQIEFLKKIIFESDCEIINKGD